MTFIPSSGPLNIPDLMALYKLDFPDLKDKPHEPVIPHVIQQTETIFDAIRQQDILLHHPYESFRPVLEFVRAAQPIRACWQSSRHSIE